MTVVEIVDAWVVVYLVAVARAVSYEVTVCSRVEVWVARETIMSTYETVDVAVMKTTSTLGVL